MRWRAPANASSGVTATRKPERFASLRWQLILGTRGLKTCRPVSSRQPGRFPVTPSLHERKRRRQGRCRSRTRSRSPQCSTRWSSRYARAVCEQDVRFRQKPREPGSERAQGEDSVSATSLLSGGKKPVCDWQTAWYSRRCHVEQGQDGLVGDLSTDWRHSRAGRACRAVKGGLAWNTTMLQRHRGVEFAVDSIAIRRQALPGRWSNVGWHPDRAGSEARQNARRRAADGGLDW